MYSSMYGCMYVCMYVCVYIQYSVTEHMSHLSPGSGRGLPGIYFHYEVSPIHAIFEEKRGGMYFVFM